MNVGSLRLAAAVMTMASGWTLVLAGYVAYTGSWAAGALITLPSGPLILVALATAARADRVGSDTAVAGGDMAVAGRLHVPGVAVIAVTLLSGAVMFFAGWAIGAWGWALVLPITTVGGVIIAIAFALDRRGGGQ